MKKWFSVLCIILLLLTALPAFAKEAAGSSALAAYNGKRIGVQTGTSFDKMVFEQFPDAEVRKQLLYNF